MPSRARFALVFACITMLGLGCASTREPLTVAIDRDAAVPPVPLEVVGSTHGTNDTRRTPRSRIEWSSAGEEASTRDRAARERRAVFVYFSATWCGACAELEKTTFRDASVVARTTELESIQVDATNDDDPKVIELTAKYRVVGLPTMVVLDARGVEVTRITEYITGPKLAAALEKVRP